MRDYDEGLTLEDQIEDGDWAIIISSDGNLRGVYIPDGQDEDQVPNSIVHIMSECFSVDFKEEVDTSTTRVLH